MLSSFERIAVVVAHPDDETLWAGGLLARYGDKITVICCSTPSKDKVRAEKFIDACAVYGVNAYIYDTLDEGPDHLLVLSLDLSWYDAIVTHNVQGEYGHLHHKQIHRYLVDRHGGSIPIFTFGASPGGHGAIEFKLTPAEEATRMRALQCYDHVLPYCGRPLPKWQALLERYGNLKPVETYDAHQP